MDEAIIDILSALRERETLEPKQLDRIVRKHSKRAHDGRRLFSKKRILSHYLDVRKNDPECFSSWDVDDDLDARMIATLKMKPRRTASGVATITVITKPWGCSSTCIYCPNDVRMPKSYLHDEPACQRAERNYFDPYLQVASRLHALQNMGHATDKVELIVLGGTWTDYPSDYLVWFVREMFRALNDDEARARCTQERRDAYESLGIEADPFALESACEDAQHRVNSGEITFNAAVKELYELDDSWSRAATFQHASWDDLIQQHVANEKGDHRVVGLVVETRPSELDIEQLTALRKLGCTKIQMGIQSLDPNVLALNHRNCAISHVERAFALCRLFGFKTHAHFMANLFGSSPEADKLDYERLVTDEAFLPDEVKLYPCMLVAGTKLVSLYDEGLWRPYTEDELIDVLRAAMIATPPYMRISRMIRDISAKDIMAGNKKTNLRQLVDRSLGEDAHLVREIRFREIATSEIDLSTLVLDDVRYHTTVSREHFLQWVTPDQRIAGFLRLSLPDPHAIGREGENLPIRPSEAMIREVHVYGFAAKLSSDGESAQHHGLGKKLIERACEIAHDAGYERINVISAVGTREYYRKLGFADNGLYQQKRLDV